MERDGSNHGLPDLEKLSLEKGRALDVEDLTPDGWRAASEGKMIVELGSLGEGAGGAVTRCILKGGKTIFALKVRFIKIYRKPSMLMLSRSLPQIPIRMSRNRSCANLLSTETVLRNTSASTTELSQTTQPVPYP